MKFSYSNQGNLIKQWKFANNLSLANCLFIGDVLPDLKKKKPTGNKNEKNEEDEKKIFPYVLLCYIDVQKVSDFILPDDLGYIIRVYASNTISFIKDKTKEEHEKKLKEKWEENDEGRSKLAMKSRMKFLVYAKNLKKEILNEKEQKILDEERKRRTANEIDHITSIDENEGKNNKKKGKKNEGNKGESNKDKDKGKNTTGKNKGNQLNSDDEDNLPGIGLFNKSLYNYFKKTERPLSMLNIFKHQKPNYNDSKAKFISNFINYSNKERTIYKKLSKMPMIKKNKNQIYRNRRLIISDEKYRENIKSNIISQCEASEIELKKNNEDYLKVSHEYFDKINNFNKNLSSQRRAQSIDQNTLLSRRKKLQTYIQKKLDIKKEILQNINENQKFLENLKTNKKEINNKKGEGINYEEQLKLYKDAKIYLDKDTDVIKFFNILSSIKEEELKDEYEKLKGSNDKNKEATLTKMIDDIKQNNWNINKNFIEKLEKEIEEKNVKK